MPLDADDEKALQTLADRLATRPDVLFLTGAGLSADSGLPTYRGVGGLYHDEATEHGLPIEEALSGPVFRGHPEITWKYLLDVERAGRGAAPNRGHEVIARFERELPRVVTLTQNVDGLHRAAGSKNLIEIHGDLHLLVCPTCGDRREVATYEGLDLPPRCPHCLGVIRPEVVLFGEMLPADALARLRAELARGFGLVVAVGTSAMFPYIQEPVVRMGASGALTAEINPGETELSDAVDLRIRAGAAEALDRLWALYEARR